MTAPGHVSPDTRDLLRRACAAYDARDVEALLALVSDDVDWPDGGVRLRGREQLRTYWTEQWARTRTHDEPVGFAELDDGRTAVRVRQVVRSLDGAVVSRSEFRHVHHIEAGLITRLDVEDAPVR